MRLGGESRLRQEIFYLAYHLHWSRTEISALDIGERHEFVRLLAERIEADNKALDDLGDRLRQS
jgi:hypothetical protein